MQAVAATMTEDGSAARRGPRVLRVRAAGRLRRSLAAAIDAAIVLAASAVLAALGAVLLAQPLPGRKELAPDLLLGALLDRDPVAVGGAALSVAVGALYEIVLGGIGGQTPGKRLCRLRVIDRRGVAPGLAGGIARCVALFLSLVPAGLGWLWFAFDRERRGLHDHLAGTYVIVQELDR